MELRDSGTNRIRQLYPPPEGSKWFFLQYTTPTHVAWYRICRTCANYFDDREIAQRGVIRVKEKGDRSVFEAYMIFTPDPGGWTCAGFGLSGSPSANPLCKMKPALPA